MNVTLDSRAARIRAAFDRTERGRQEWVAGTIELATELYAVRCELDGDDRRFGVWLAENELDDLGKNDRAALIKIGEHIGIARPILQECAGMAWRKLWEEEIGPRVGVTIFPKVGNDAPEAPPEPENAPQVITTPIEPVSAIQNGPKLEGRPQYDLVSTGSAAVKNPEAMRLPKLLDIPFDQFSLVMKSYPYNRQKILKAQFTALAEGRPKKTAQANAVRLFMMALDVVKSGNAPALSNSKGFDARVIIPHVPESFCKYYSLADLAHRIDQLQLLDSTAAALQRRNASIEVVHKQLAHIWEHGTLLQEQAATVVIAVTDSKNKIKHEVKYCGKMIWPSEQLKHVTYDDLNAGWHLIDYWVKYLETATPQKPREIGTIVRHLIHDIAAGSSKQGLVEVMLVCVGAYSETNEHLSKNDLSNSMAPGLAR